LSYSTKVFSYVHPDGARVSVTPSIRRLYTAARSTNGQYPTKIPNRVSKQSIVMQFTLSQDTKQKALNPSVWFHPANEYASRQHRVVENEFVRCTCIHKESSPQRQKVKGTTQFSSRLCLLLPVVNSFISLGLLKRKLQ
jgi:hypothetical protein